MIVTATIVALCWAVFVIYWVVSARDVKRTVERRGDWWRATEYDLSLRQLSGSREHGQLAWLAVQ